MTLPASTAENYRQPNGDRQLRYWLENMVVHHQFATSEVAAATGLSVKTIEASIERWDLREQQRERASSGKPLRVFSIYGRYR